jgi:uncharacterized repeat protein (TIGR01451 family)
MRFGFPGIGIVLLVLLGASSSVPASGQSALTISKSAPASVVSGQNLTWTLTYGNLGPSNLTDVVVTDTLPAGTTFVSATGAAPSRPGSLPGTSGL